MSKPAKSHSTCVAGWIHGRIAMALIMLSLLFGAPTSVLAETVTVFAASSLKPVLDSLAPDFEAQTGHQTQMSFAGSALIARQIEQGAPADVFVSANPQWMTYLVDKGRVHDAHRVTLAGNRLALISARSEDANQNILDILNTMTAGDRIAMGLVSAVPAGQYGKAALEHLALWDGVAPFVVQMDNVRAALNLVALNEVRLGIVYASDAISTPHVHLVGIFPAESHPQIVYPMAAVGPAPSDATLGFLAFMQSDMARARLDRFGFLPIKP